MNKLKKFYTNLKLYLLFAFCKHYSRIPNKNIIEIKNKTFRKVIFNKYLNKFSEDSIIEFVNCSFTDCNFNSIKLKSIRFDRCCGDFELLNCNLDEIYIYNCNFRSSTISSGELKCLRIMDSTMFIFYIMNSNINSIVWVRVNFMNCNLHQKLSRSNSCINDCTFRSCSFKYPDQIVSHSMDCIGLESMCPEEGSFIAYKKASVFNKLSNNDCDDNKCIVKLLITSDAKRSSATSSKCRASKVKVLEIQDFEGNKLNCVACSSFWDNNTLYKVGETIEVKNFDENRWEECSTGIHFFMNRRNAVNY